METAARVNLSIPNYGRVQSDPVRFRESEQIVPDTMVRCELGLFGLGLIAMGFLLGIRARKAGQSAV